MNGMSINISKSSADKMIGYKYIISNKKKRPREEINRKRAQQLSPRNKMEIVEEYNQYSV